jgi:alpha-N-arabinofuranosidase
MRLRGLRCGLGCLALVVAVPVMEAVAGGTVTVHADRTRPEINPFIYGQFIEHLGRCIYGGIWAEMLEDRKFYHPVTAEYAPYRSLRDTEFPVVGASPWQVVGGSVTMDTVAPFVGHHTPKLEPGTAIRQNDLGVVADKSYVGYVWLKASGPGASATATLIWGDGPEARQTVSIPAVGTEYQKYSLSYKAGARTDKAALEVKVEGSSAIWVGNASLMPADNVRGMRADTLALLKQLGGTIYRWPGGNFVSGYNWRDGVGDRDRRPPRTNPAWTGLEHNDFGMHEFLDFCREIGTEPMIAANTGLGDADSAALEVEYANGGPSTVGGAMRVANGQAQPFGVKYWCVGNEMWGPWQLGFMQLKHYTFKHNLAAQAMWRADPSLQLVGSGALGHRNPKYDPDEKRGWTEGMLADCAQNMNLISEHFYVQGKRDLNDHVQQVVREIRDRAAGHRKLQTELGLLPGRAVPIAMDEWNFWYGPHLYGELGTRYFLDDALGIAAGLHEYYRNSDIYGMAHYAQTVNVIGCIKTTKTEAFLDATALPLILYRHHYGTIPVELGLDGLPEGLDVVAAWTSDRKALTVGIVNATTEPQSVAVRTEGASLENGALSWTVAGQDRKDFNAPGKSPLVIVESKVDFQGSLAVAPLSMTVVRIPVR